MGVKERVELLQAQQRQQDEERQRSLKATRLLVDKRIREAQAKLRQAVKNSGIEPLLALSSPHILVPESALV